MYTVDSTHGLRASAHSIDQTVSILGRHLADCRRGGQIDWLIISPEGHKISGCIDVSPTPAAEAARFLADLLNDIRADLAAAAAADGRWSGPAEPTPRPC
jgi:hypothetical protein